MSLGDIFGSIKKGIRGASALSHVGGDAKALKGRFVVVIEQRVRAESKEDVEAAVEKLEAQLQQMGGLTPLIEMCGFEKPVLADGLPEVTVKGKE